LPYQTAIDDGDLAEERRLCYVAITRARKHLHMSYGRERQRFGSAKDVTPSRFLNEMRAASPG
jgi:DNA helicase-2/ATP-dependent DNA helicase PcrA